MKRSLMAAVAAGALMLSPALAAQDEAVKATEDEEAVEVQPGEAPGEAIETQIPEMGAELEGGVDPAEEEEATVEVDPEEAPTETIGEALEEQKADEDDEGFAAAEDDLAE